MRLISISRAKSYVIRKPRPGPEPLELCSEIKKRDADLFDLKLSLAESEFSLLRAKVWTLEKENASLRAKLELNTDIAQTIKEIVPKIEEIKNHNSQALKEELPSIIKQVACPDIKSSLESVNREIVAEVKKNRVEARSFAQVAFQAKDMRQGPSPLLKSRDPEGILLVKPKEDTHRDFETNRKIILDTLQTHSPEVRLRGVSKIYGGGVKLIAASPDDITAIKDTITENLDSESIKAFDLITPNRRSPQFILYGVPKDTDEKSLCVWPFGQKYHSSRRK
ncbi:hypothetical protein AVEN_132638-1 [Araneus ventricosus]|uniref:Uncharacterized protein n=1 Tax=Araneus ventricosus TaxID=182803 RepID=A0A4Y2AW26_ARAVE|nr:hypothetical protein AVEN_132638-1 [Araneus ventricosus]